MRPLHVVASTAEAEALIRKLSLAGWTRRDGFALMDTSWDIGPQTLVCVGRLGDTHTASQAVLAAARGAGVVAICDPTGALGRRVRRDLERIGPLGWMPGTGEASANDVGLDEQQCKLLDHLAQGLTIAAAAEAEFISLRTANRRIAAARRSFGVSTTRQAVVAYVQHISAADG
ncbi:LuxR family transcriptional regulator [Natronoglycomyces albus]|uniref:LuxR family transcriptional regulator n=1 Tax=Natronoglycomyces albus TaxID=2811108 RepID=A0A895XW80_9ACTN|nr:LuxR family transcriptional regulator [Natronoglycomyces albus]QSB06786.1 LuxR family transcriptional regulator [Natronoglycomyces albus]